MKLDRLATLDRELNQMIMQGDVLNALDRFYADDVVMQENDQEPTVGKAANREREKEFFGSIDELHSAKIHSSAAGDHVTFAEMSFDATLKDGSRMKMREIARREWNDDGKIVHERFYYDA